MVTNGYKRKLIFLTGASGFIGSRLLKKLLSNGYRVKVLLNKNDVAIVHSNLKKIKGDVCDESISDNLKGVDVVVHLAAYMGSLKEFGPDKFMKINYLGTKNIFDLSKKHKCRFIYCSSIVVKDEKNSMDWYAKSKLMATAYVKKESKNDLTVVYPTAVIDSGRLKEGRFAPGFLMTRVGQGKRIINIVDVENVTNAIFEIVKNKKNKGDYVLGGINIKVSDYLKKMSKLRNGIYIPIRIPQWFVRFLVLVFFGKTNLYNIFCKKFSDRKVYSTKAIKDFGYVPEKNLNMLTD